MTDRSKIYPSSEELVKLGFERKGSGNDPRDYWYEIDLSNDSNDSEITLELDAYFDFVLNIPELIEPIPLNFKTVQEVEIFIAVFKRPWNGAFAGMLDVFRS